jgi:NTP pyrophosphatase (non-canonical NTP hydrolase)
MESQEYRKACWKTAGNFDKEKHLSMLGMGIAGEAGEITDSLKKAIFQGHDLDVDKLAEEVGDLMYYVELLLDTIGVSTEIDYKKNVEKIERRYPNGFEPERSKNREGDAS